MLLDALDDPQSVKLWKRDPLGNGVLESCTQEKLVAWRSQKPEPTLVLKDLTEPRWDFGKQLMQPIVLASHSLRLQSLALLADCSPSEKDSIRETLPDEHTKLLFDGFHAFHQKFTQN
jgi:hypothetical protein